MREVEQEDGSISCIPTEQTYTGIRYEYSYIISDINPLKDRIEAFFENNSEAVEEARGDMKTYFISDLDSVITLSLNTYSLGNKNLYAYFNFNSRFNNWYDNLITFNTDILNENSSLDITPANENFFGVNKGTESLSGGDRETDTKFTVSLERRILVNPDGTEIDMFLQQNSIADAIEATNPTKVIELALPVTEDLDIVATYFGGTVLDDLDISTAITAVQVKDVQFDEGDILPDEDGYIN
jgi:hypothetical protein